MHGCWRGGHAWLLARGVCMLAGGHAWLPGGVHGCRGGVVARGHAWLLGGMRACQGGMHRIQRDMVNEWAVRILLECILVQGAFTRNKIQPVTDIRTRYCLALCE